MTDPTHDPRTVPDPDPTRPPHADAFADYLVRTRWFGGKGRDFTVTGVRLLAALDASRSGVPSRDYLVEVTYADDGSVETYQVPLVCYEQPEHRLDHAFVGWWDEPGLGWTHAYDALHDHAAMATWLGHFGGPQSTGPLDFVRVGDDDIDLDARASLFSGEQSNSTALFGDDSVLKIFRKVTPGPNPDITTHEVLTAVGSVHVASLYGYVAGSDPATGEVLHLAMLQQFLRTASDGWELALGSVRGLYAEGELDLPDHDTPAYASGGDFAGESGRLGAALREVHDVLAEHFESTADGDALEVAERMRLRLADALPGVPELADHVDMLHTLYDRVAALGTIPVQRIHADLHLGQTLRTSVGWKIVDFEGEPARPLVERLRPDSRWRDVAGMLRSFAYAPHVVRRLLAEEDPEQDAELERRAAEWTVRNRSAFLNAYTEGALDDTDHTLLTAYLADKAVYECLYEARNRPTWLPIPLAAVVATGAS